MSVGVKGISLTDGDKVICGSQCVSSDIIFLMYSNGGLKNIKIDPCFETQRNKKGIKLIPTKIKDANLSYAGILKQSKNYVVQTTSNNLVYIANSEVKLESIDSVGKVKTEIKNNIKKVFEYITL